MKWGGPRARGKESESRLFANAPTYKRWLNINIRCAAKMAAFPVSGARAARALPVRSRGTRDPTDVAVWGTGRYGGLAHVAGCEGAVEAGGGFGEFARRQPEKVGCGADKLGGDVASVDGVTPSARARARKRAASSSGKRAVSA